MRFWYVELSASHALYTGIFPTGQHSSALTAVHANSMALELRQIMHARM
jgi:hypothetical protein